jgi:hypothetical protein
MKFIFGDMWWGLEFFTENKCLQSLRTTRKKKGCQRIMGSQWHVHKDQMLLFTLYKQYVNVSSTTQSTLEQVWVNTSQLWQSDLCYNVNSNDQIYELWVSECILPNPNEDCHFHVTNSCIEQTELSRIDHYADNSMTSACSRHDAYILLASYCETLISLS